jgi:hypothetical protein
VKRRRLGSSKLKYGLAHLTGPEEKLATFSKNRSKIDDNIKLPYETIYRIAKMYIVEKLTPLAICKDLDLNYNSVKLVISARKQQSDWLDAIASLGREGLIDE